MVDLELSGSDVSAMLDIAHSCRQTASAEGLPLDVLALLADLVPCDLLSLCELDSGTQETGWDQEVPESRLSADDGAFWRYYWDSEHCSYPDRTGDVTRVTMTSDFLAPSEYRENSAYQEFLKPFGIDHELMVVFSLGHWHTARLLFGRAGGGKFTERDRAVLTLLRPHLDGLVRRADAARRPTPVLTPRQWELMRLVAGGCTNAQVARRLFLSEATVRKHLENVFHRLDVTNRTAAIAGAFPDRIGA